LYFIITGSVEALSADGKIVYTVLTSGNYFGDISLIFKCPCLATTRAVTDCELFVLSKPDLDKVLALYPYIKAKVSRQAKERKEIIKELNSKPSKEILGENRRYGWVY